jgi:hypothetical protein
MHVAAVTRYGEGHSIDISYLWLGVDENLFKALAFPISVFRTFSPSCYHSINSVICGVCKVDSANAGTGTSPRDLQQIIFVPLRERPLERWQSRTSLSYLIPL